MQQAGEITGLLAGRQGDHATLDPLIPLVRKELSRIARHHLGRMRNNDRMQPSSLVHEAFVRLLPDSEVGWRDRSHFFAIASLVMRHVLLNYAPRKALRQTGETAVHVPVNAAVVLSPERLDQIVAVDLARERLARTDERKSKVLEMRFFGGLTVEETARVLGGAPNTVVRDWNFAQAWLGRELSGGGVPNSGTMATG